ncbi:MAG: signal peptidase II [Clostridiales bacterium]|nr:signal peptidase II [Clostridiales bacterium]
MPIALIALLSGLVLAIDQVSKFSFKEANLILIPGFLKLSGTRSTGIAFGALSGSVWILPLLTGLITGLIVLYIIKSRPYGLLAVGLSLILGGALGNLIDRLLYGYVIDFVELLFVRFAVFNAADIAITVGCVLCFIAILFVKEEVHV